MKHIRLLTLFLILGITTLSAQKPPKREFRGAWIQTVFQSEYANMTSEEMKADFIRKLDLLQPAGSTPSFSKSVLKLMPGTCRK